MTNNFEFDDFDTQETCEEYYGNGPTDAELQELMAEGEWEPEPMFPYDEEYRSPEELADIFRSLGFNVVEVEYL